MIKDEDLILIMDEIRDHFNATKEDFDFVYKEFAKHSRPASYAARLSIVDDLAESLNYDISHWNK